MVGSVIPSPPDGASVILYKRGQVLLYKRDRHPQIFPGRWALFGGGIEGEETPEETLVRELKAELGYWLPRESLEYLGRFNVEIEPHRYTVHYYRAELRQDFWDVLLGLSAANGLEREGEGIALFSHAEIDSLQLMCQDRMALERHFRGRGFGFVD